MAIEFKKDPTCLGLIFCIANGVVIAVIDTFKMKSKSNRYLTVEEWEQILSKMKEFQGE